MKTQVAIIGGGPSGLMLSQVLEANGISSIIIERKTKEYVLGRIRAGVLEDGTVQMLRKYGVGERLDREGMPHDGVLIEWQGQPSVMIDGPKYTGKPLTTYGQTQITEDLYEAREAAGQKFFYEVDDVELFDLESDNSYLTFKQYGESHRIDCDYIAGCDGFHGVSRPSIPETVRTEYERVYPFGWLGVLADVKPLDEVIYAYHEKGFALASQRSPTRSRYYVQVPLTDKIEDWSDERFWDELKSRFPKHWAEKIETGPSIEKSIAPLRSFVCEPLQYGRLFLVGDAGHIVPPTGAKGLNLAFSDVHYLSNGLVAKYRDGDDGPLREYSETALKRTWGAIRLSWWLTTLLHVFPDDAEFDRKIRMNEYQHLVKSDPALANLAEQFVGLPY